MKTFVYTHQDLDLWRLIVRVRHAIFRARTKELRQYNISSEQAGVMFVVQALGDRATPAEIARWLFREPHSVSHCLNKMERDGLVQKLNDLDRKNMVRVVLTEKGREAHYQTTKLESVHRIMSCLSKGEPQQLMALLEKLWYKSLEELGLPHRPPYPPLK